MKVQVSLRIHFNLSFILVLENLGIGIEKNIQGNENFGILSSEDVLGSIHILKDSIMQKNEEKA